MGGGAWTLFVPATAVHYNRISLLSAGQVLFPRQFAEIATVDSLSSWRIAVEPLYSFLWRASLQVSRRRCFRDSELRLSAKLIFRSVQLSFNLPVFRRYRLIGAIL